MRKLKEVIVRHDELLTTLQRLMDEGHSPSPPIPETLQFQGTGGMIPNYRVHLYRVIYIEGNLTPAERRIFGDD